MLPTWRTRASRTPSHWERDLSRTLRAGSRADQDAIFQEEARNRQRGDWKEADHIKAADKQDLADVNGAATASAAGAGAAGVNGAVSAVDPQAPMGIPKPRDFNGVLARQAELLRRKSERGDLGMKDYAQGMQAINTLRGEGVDEALRSFSAGDYEGGINAFNQIGQHKGARIIKGETGSTKINGMDVPTHYVTIANPDGSRTVVDSAKAQYQLMDLNSQMAHVDRARQTDMQGTQHAEQIKLGRDTLTQHAKDAAQGRALQAKGMQIQLDQYQASTPLGQITAMGKALGRPLTTDEVENRLGVSRIPRAIEMQVASLMKESDVESSAVAKAIASPEGINPTAAGTFQKNAAIRNERLSQLLAPYSGSRRSSQAADPLQLNSPKAGGTTVPNPMARSEGHIPAVLTPAAGVAAAKAATTGATTMPKGAIDVREDTVLASLSRSTQAMDMNDPANVQAIMAIGKARADRLTQLQQNYGPNAILFAD